MTRNLSVRITITLIASAVLLSLLSSFFFYQRIHDQQMAHSLQLLHQLGKTVQRTASIAAYLDNVEIAQETVSGLAENRIVGLIQLSSYNGLLAEYGNISQQDQRFTVSLELFSPFSPTESVGFLKIQPQYTLLETLAADAARERITIIFSYTFVVALIALASMQWLFIRPLKKIAAQLGTITPGHNQSLPTPLWHSNDEIGGVVENINKLLHVVDSTIVQERNLRSDIEHLEQQFRMIFERASVSIFLMNAKGQILMANPAFMDLMGQTDLRRCQHVNCLSKIFVDQDTVLAMIRKTVELGEISERDLELKATRGSQYKRWGHCLFNRIRTERAPQHSDKVYIQGFINDITARKTKEQELLYQAGHDPLTGLLNRRASEQAITAMLEQMKTDTDIVALFIIDLDDFKPVNDTHGHDAGDIVLIETANRIKSFARNHDISSRLGGDEFLFAIKGPLTLQNVEKIADRLCKQLILPITLSPGVTVRVGASIGIALSLTPGDALKTLQSNADKALYHVKSQGKNNFAIITCHLTCRVMARHSSILKKGNRFRMVRKEGKRKKTDHAFLLARFSSGRCAFSTRLRPLCLAS